MDTWILVPHFLSLWSWGSPLETPHPPPEASSPVGDRGVESGARGWLRETWGGSWLRGLVL